MAAPCSQWIACSPVRNGRRGGPLNRIVSPNVTAIAMLLVLAANSRVILNETCHELNPMSAIDRAYLEALPASGIPFKLWDGSPCFADADEPRATALKSKLEAQYPHTCVAFEKAWNVTAVETKLREAKVPVWREKVVPSGGVAICHLTRDGAKVKAAVHEVFPDLK